MPPPPQLPTIVLVVAPFKIVNHCVGRNDENNGRKLLVLLKRPHNGQCTGTGPSCARAATTPLNHCNEETTHCIIIIIISSSSSSSIPPAKSCLKKAVLSRMRSSPFITRLARQPHGASRLVQASNVFCLVGKNPDVVHPGIVGTRGSMVIRLPPCMIMSAPPRQSGGGHNG